MECRLVLMIMPSIQWRKKAEDLRISGVLIKGGDRGRRFKRFRGKVGSRGGHCSWTARCLFVLFVCLPGGINLGVLDRI